ncbi:MAG: hypothetical protein JWP01_3285 [Myxococcales bacterium]|nr:hypothetical protein [Myxococcales bacterium]
MHKLALAAVTIGATIAAAAPVRTPKALARPLVFRIFDPGALPGPHGRTTLRLTTTGDHASLAITTERPPQNQRGQQNPTEWVADPDATAQLDGVVKTRRNGFTFWLKQAGHDKVVLVCTNASADVHAAGATVQPALCSPCYDSCPAGAAGPIWKPARTRRTSGLQCIVRSPDDVDADGTAIAREDAAAPSLPTLGVATPRLFFLPAPGVEHLYGPTDCPPEGLRAARRPR